MPSCWRARCAAGRCARCCELPALWRPRWPRWWIARCCGYSPWELFLVFSVRWSPVHEGTTLRLHFGHGGGYVVEPSDGSGAWGPKAAGGGHRRDQYAQIQLEFKLQATDSASPAAASAAGAADRGQAAQPRTLKLLLWDELGSFYGQVPPEYLKAAEARAIFDINATEDVFAYDGAVQQFVLAEELVVDLIMDQSRLPGVGNIIKCEGLFAAGIHPLRRASELSEEEWLRLLKALRDFSDDWYRHCQKSENGQLMGCCHLMRVYGHRSCSACQSSVSLIKEGTRQRITYFCPRCQAVDKDQLAHEIQRQHKNELVLELPLCSCGLMPALLQRRAGLCWGGDHDRRPFLACSRKHGSSYDDGGCGVTGPWDGCDFGAPWLDELTGELPRCHCGQPGLLRRVCGLKENGKYFFRCATRSCHFRCWLRLSSKQQPANVNVQAPSSGASRSCVGTVASSAGRWRRSRCSAFAPEGRVREQAATSEADDSLAALQARITSLDGQHLSDVRKDVQSGDSSDPTTSGDGDDQPRRARPACTAALVSKPRRWKSSALAAG